MTTRGGVSVVIVSFGHGATLPAALDSLAKIGGDLLDVVVVDNAGDLAEGLETQLSPVEPSVVFAGSNLGYAAGANLGVSKTQGEILMFLSPDAELLFFDRRRALQSLGQAIGAVGALTLDSQDRASISWGEFPGVRRAVRGVSGMKERFDKRVLEAAANGEEVTVPWVLGSAVTMLRGTFDQVGGYDPVYVAAGEDQDFGRRLQLAGLRSVVSSSWKARHQPRSAESLREVIRSNEIRFLQRYGGFLDRALWTLARGGRI